MKIVKYKYPKKIYSMQMCLNAILTPQGFVPPKIEHTPYIFIQMNYLLGIGKLFVFTNSLFDTCLGYIKLNRKELIQTFDKKYVIYLKKQLKKLMR